MAKDEKQPDKTPEPVAAPCPFVRVTISRAIAVGGVYLAPRIDGKRVIPVEAVIPRAAARAHGLAMTDAPGETKPRVVTP